MDNPSIVVDHLTKRFDSFTAVNDVSFGVGRGEVFGFLGPNGAGKTTIIRMLCGLLVPSQGKITVEGLDITKDTDRVKAIIGYMSQKFSLYADLTVLENLRFYGGIYGVPSLEKKTLDMVGFLEIEEYKDTITAELPAGIRQRVALAASYVHNPKVLFLDEPTAGVDPLLRKKFWEIIKKLSGQGTTVLVTTHYMDEAENCGRILLINQGAIADTGSVEEIKERFKKGNILYLELESEYVKNFEKLKKLDFPVKDLSLHGSVAHIVQDIDLPAAKKKLAAFCRAEDIGYKNIVEDRPTLEDVFVHLVRRTKK